MVLRTSTRTLLIAGVSLGALAATAFEGHAGGFAVREQSAVGQGSSFAGAGTPGMGLSSMYWNPAAITATKGMMSESHFSAVLPNTDLSAQPGTSPALLAIGANAGNVGQDGLLPVSYGAYQFSPSLFVGYSFNVPYGLATKTNSPWAGQQLGVRGEVKSVDFAPIVGWKVNDWLSVGAGPRVLWLQGRFESALVPSAAFPATSFLKVDDYAFGFAAGVTFTPSPATEIALGYRSQVKLNLDGKQPIPLVPGPVLAGIAAVNPARAALLTAIQGTQPGVKGDVTTPDQVTLSVRHRFNERLTLLGTVEWANWSNVQTVPFTFTTAPVAGVASSTLTFNYRDGWLFAGGAEYAITPQYTARAGIAYEISPVRDAVRDPILPDNNRWWFSAGLSSKVFDWITLDFGYSFIYVGDTQVSVVPGHPDYATIAPSVLYASADPYIHVVALSARINWSAAPPTITGN